MWSKHIALLAALAAAPQQQPLKGKKIAVLATMGVEKIELTAPVAALREAGATVEIISPDGKPIRAMDWPEWSGELPVDRALGSVKPQDYDALYLPGGIINPDLLKLSDAAVRFVRDFAREKKPIGAMCHAPSLLIAAGVVKGHQITSWPSLKTDLTNAGATWVDREVVVSKDLVTSRNPKDIPALDREMVKLFARR